MKLFLDMDGTIANTYDVSGWLDCLLNEDTSPYYEAKPLCDGKALAEVLQAFQDKGCTVGIVSWMSKANPSKAFKMRTRRTKKEWLKRHIPFAFDEIHIQNYGENKGKWNNGQESYLVDDVFDIPFKGGKVIPTECEGRNIHGVLDALEYLYFEQFGL